MRSVLRIAALTATVAGLAGAAAPARAAEPFDITRFSTTLQQRVVSPADPEQNVSAPLLTAGAHPDAAVDVQFPETLDDSVDTASVDFPAGFNILLGDAPRCPRATFLSGRGGSCANDTIIGSASVRVANGQVINADIINLEPEPGVPVEAGFIAVGATVLLRGSVRTGSDYGITVSARRITTIASLQGFTLTLAGVPSQRPSRDDPASPFDERDPTVDAPAITSNPTSCPGQSLPFTVRASTYGDPGRVLTRGSSAAADGSPQVITDCVSLPFDPSVAVKPTTTAPDSPTGLDVSVAVPQRNTSLTRSSAHLKDLSLLLPEGMTVNPAAADGLQSCSAAQIGLDNANAAQCPDASSLGEVAIDTPLVAEPLTGKVYLAAQGANPFGTTLALYLVANGPGIVIKLPGRVDPDPVTGRLRVTFSDAPQLAFSTLDVSLDDGPRAVLTTPAACGTQTVAADVTPWSGGATRSLTSSFDIDCAPGLGGFAPTFNAGTTPALAGRYSPLSFVFGRPDGQQTLSNVSVTLPPGLVARPAAVTPCTEAQATADACPAGSKVGSARVLLGAGSAPFPLAGEAFLTGPYEGAPYGLLVRFRAIAGPLDLGTVVVRQSLSIDPDDAHVTAVSDPLPTVVGGVPIRLRELALNLDKPDFAVNPTSCAPTAITAALGGAGGTTANVASKFAVAGCPALRLQPQLRLSLTGKRSYLRKGGHPGISARLTQAAGQSNLKRVEAKLPVSLALDPENAQLLCEAPAAAAKAPSCPKGSAIGSATVRTSLLPEPLTGPVYFAKGVRTSKTGKQVRTLPTLVLPLRGSGVQINVRANTAVRGGKLVAQFDGIPDAPISRFDLKLDGGRHGVLVATKAVCARTRLASVRFRGHSGRLVTATRNLRAACGR